MTDPIDRLLAAANPVPTPDALDAGDTDAALQRIMSSAEPAGQNAWQFHPHLTLTVRDEIGILHFDDGHANVLTGQIINAYQDAIAFSDADPGIRALVLAGRPGFFSAGLDRDQVFGQDALHLVTELARLARMLFALDKPVVAAGQGHAIAAGAVLLLVSDVRVGVADPCRIGLNEAAIGLPLPRWITDLARSRLATRDFQRATAAAHMFDPAGAVSAGFLDHLADGDVLDHAVKQAAQLTRLDSAIYTETIRRTRADVLAAMDRFIADPAGLGI